MEINRQLNWPEISKKIEDEQYDVQKGNGSDTGSPGSFEQKMREESKPELVEKRFNETQKVLDKSIQDSLAKREEAEKNKPKPQRKQKGKPSKSVPKPKDFIGDLKNLKGTRG